MNQQLIEEATQLHHRVVVVAKTQAERRAQARRILPKLKRRVLRRLVLPADRVR